jgi:hypothetical protein
VALNTVLRDIRGFAFAPAGTSDTRRAERSASDLGMVKTGCKGEGYILPCLDRLCAPREIAGRDART